MGIKAVEYGKPILHEDVESLIVKRLILFPEIDVKYTAVDNILQPIEPSEVVDITPLLHRPPPYETNQKVKIPDLTAW